VEKTDIAKTPAALGKAIKTPPLCYFRDASPRHSICKDSGGLSQELRNMNDTLRTILEVLVAGLCRVGFYFVLTFVFQKFGNQRGKV
jgi:hypothetical protein